MSGIREMEKILECAICMDSLKNPKMLQCQHSFCAECLFKMYEKGYNLDRSHKITCPFCRITYPIKGPWIGCLTYENFIAQLPNNFMALSVMDVKEKLYSKMMSAKKSLTNGVVVEPFPSLYATATSLLNYENSCQCSRITTWWCATCSTCLCNECIADHCEVNECHEIFNIEVNELQKRRNHNSYQENDSTSNCLCGRQSDWNCHTCETNLCNDCFQDHIIVFPTHEVFEILKLLSVDSNVSELFQEFHDICLYYDE